MVLSSTVNGPDDGQSSYTSLSHGTRWRVVNAVTSNFCHFRDHLFNWI